MGYYGFRFAGGGGNAQDQRLFRPVGPDSGKADQVEALSPGIEPRIDFQQDLLRSGCGAGENGAEQDGEQGFQECLFLHGVELLVFL